MNINCHHHTDRQAAGNCISCGLAFCKDCLSESPQGLFCSQPDCQSAMRAAAQMPLTENRLAETYRLMRQHYSKGMIFQLFFFCFITFWILFAAILLLLMLILNILETFYAVREWWKDEALRIALVAAIATTLWLAQSRRLPGFRSVRCFNCNTTNPIGQRFCHTCGEKL